MRRETMAKLGLRSGWDVAVLLAYVAMLCAVVPFHEPWGDEALTWISARLNLWTMVFQVLRYEGHPALWYLLAWVLVHLHVPYEAFNWFSAAIATAGIYVFLKLSPFPLYLRAVVPFSFFLAYQYAVVARSYVLFPLLLFLVAAVYRSKKRRPIAMAVLLGLLANLTFHGATLAVGFGLVYAYTLRTGRREWLTPRSARPERWAAGIWIASFLFMAVCLWPAKDSVAPHTRSFWIYHFLALPAKADTPSKRVAASSADAQASPTPVPASTAGEGSSRKGQSLRRIVRVLTFAFAGSAWLALLYQMSVAAMLIEAKQIRLMIPMLLLAGFLLIVYTAEWHMGLLWVAVLCLLWIVWDPGIKPTVVCLQNAAGALLLLCCLSQLHWTYDADRYDMRYAYAPAKAVAAYLKHLPPDKLIAGYDEANSVSPYLTDREFFNFAPYGGWTKPRPDMVAFDDVLAVRPEAVVINREDPRVAVFLAHRYHVQETMCGSLYFPNSEIKPLCLYVLAPTRS